MIAYIALAISCFVLPTRLWIAALETATFCVVAFALVASFTIQSSSRAFWIGFAVVSFFWLFQHGQPGREFYSAPATLGEYLAHPTELYHDWSGFDDPSYDGISGATWTGPPYDHDRLRTAIRRRVRFMSNTVATIAFGFLGGIVASYIARSKIA